MKKYKVDHIYFFRDNPEKELETSLNNATDEGYDVFKIIEEKDNDTSRGIYIIYKKGQDHNEY